MRHEIEVRFTAVPVSESQAEAMEQIRVKALEMGDLIDQLSVESREKSLALTHLEDVVFWANAGISRNGRNA